MGFLSFAATSFLAFALAGAASVYLGGQVEHASARGGAFQLLCILSVVAALLLLAGYGASAGILRRFPRPLRAALLGAGCAGVFIVMLLVASALGANPAESWLLLAVLPLLGALSPLLAR